MTTPLIECHTVTKRLPSGGSTLTILDAVDFRVERGEFVAVVGPSGSGKSTLLGLLAGLDRPTEGSVRIDGESLEEKSEFELALLRRRHVGFVFQSFHLLPNLTAAENVRLPLELTGFAGARARTDELLATVGLDARGHHYPSQLSGGEQQRVAIARAFAPRPTILLADEPTGNLDRDNGRRILDLMVSLRESEGMTMVMVTHDADVSALAGRSIHLDGGRIQADERRRDPAAAGDPS